MQIAAGVPKPNLILLDVLMPGRDGYEVLACLRDNPATRDIPVIFVTSQDSMKDEEHGLERGAVDYITKPYRSPIVLARIHTQLELKGGNGNNIHRLAAGQTTGRDRYRDGKSMIRLLGCMSYAFDAYHD